MCRILAPSDVIALPSGLLAGLLAGLSGRVSDGGVAEIGVESESPETDWLALAAPPVLRTLGRFASEIRWSTLMPRIFLKDSESESLSRWAIVGVRVVLVLAMVVRGRGDAPSWRININAKQAAHRTQKSTSHL